MGTNKADKVIEDLIRKKSKKTNCLWINKGQERWLEIGQEHYHALLEAGFPLLEGKLKSKRIVKVFADCDYPE